MAPITEMETPMKIRSLPAFLLPLLFSASAWAHHGWSSYDSEKAVKIEVALAEVQYRNPHAEVAVDHQDKRWQVILAPISRMESRGLEKESLAVGKTVTIEGFPRKDGTAEIRAERITVSGKVIELR